MYPHTLSFSFFNQAATATPSTTKITEKVHTQTAAATAATKQKRQRQQQQKLLYCISIKFINRLQSFYIVTHWDSHSHTRTSWQRIFTVARCGICYVECAAKGNGNVKDGVAIQTNWNTSIEMEHRIAFMGYKYNTQHAFRYAPIFPHCFILLRPRARSLSLSQSPFFAYRRSLCVCVCLSLPLLLNSFLVWNIRLEQVAFSIPFPPPPRFAPSLSTPRINIRTHTLCKFSFVIHFALSPGVYLCPPFAS